MSKAEAVANATAALSNAQAASPSDQGAIDNATAALAAANALPADSPVNPSPSPSFYGGQSASYTSSAAFSPADAAAYTDGEHEAMLTHLDHMHHESRGQTIARLEAALALAKAAVGDFLSPLATRTETVTREVTIDPSPVTSALTPAEEAEAARQTAAEVPEPPTAG
jgi:hypothetical protein